MRRGLGEGNGPDNAQMSAVSLPEVSDKQEDLKLLGNSRLSLLSRRVEHMTGTRKQKVVIKAAQRPCKQPGLPRNSAACPAQPLRPLLAGQWGFVHVACGAT